MKGVCEMNSSEIQRLIPPWTGSKQHYASSLGYWWHLKIHSALVTWNLLSLCVLDPISFLISRLAISWRQKEKKKSSFTFPARCLRPCVMCVNSEISDSRTSVILRIFTGVNMCDLCGFIWANVDFSASVVFPLPLAPHMSAWETCLSGGHMQGCNYEWMQKTRCCMNVPGVCWEWEDD